MDKRVELYGLTRQDMNGKRGLATDFHFCVDDVNDQTKWRYTVKLDSGESVKVKPANVRAAPAGGGGGGAGGGAKAKGKGKKGRGGK